MNLNQRHKSKGYGDGWVAWPKDIKMLLDTKNFRLYLLKFNSCKRRANQICIWERNYVKDQDQPVIHQHIALVIFIAAAELTENLHLEDCLLLHFLSIVEGKFPSSTLILSEPGFLIHFLSRLQQRRLQFGGTPFVVYRNMEFKLHS